MEAQVDLPERLDQGAPGRMPHGLEGVREERDAVEWRGRGVPVVGCQAEGSGVESPDRDDQAPGGLPAVSQTGCGQNFKAFGSEPSQVLEVKYFGTPLILPTTRLPSLLDTQMKRQSSALTFVGQECPSSYKLRS